jgi:ketosteroid isomerase-like protein
MMTLQTSNEELVRHAFKTWAATCTGVFDILADNVRWTIAGSGPSAQTFNGRAAFLEGAFDPIAASFAGPMVPTIRDLIADGDTVAVRWDGAAPTKDGQTYRNSYAWFFTLRDGQVVEATAFLDLPTYDAALAGTALPPWPEAAPDDVGPDA